MAAMSGSLGTWPISPAAKPAPSPRSPSNASRDPTGTSFALGRAYMSTNCANTNSMPRVCMSFQIASAVAVPAILQPSSNVGGIALPAGAVRLKVRVAHLLGADVCESAVRRSAERMLELDHLHRDLDREPVVAAQVEA